MLFAGTGDVSSISEEGTFELYYIAANDLTINPVTENAKELRELAVVQGGVCDITFDVYRQSIDDSDSYIQRVIESIDTDDCGINVCSRTQCQEVFPVGCPDPKVTCNLEGYKVSSIYIQSLIDFFVLRCSYLLSYRHFINNRVVTATL